MWNCCADSDPGTTEEGNRRSEKGQVDVIIGTHVTFPATYSLKKSTAVIVDEEQRLGATYGGKSHEVKKDGCPYIDCERPFPALFIYRSGTEGDAVLEEPW